MNKSILLAILLMAAVTFLTRWLPFAAFRPGQPIPKTIAYLGQVLPLAMMAMLVVYGLRSTDSVSYTHLDVYKRQADAGSGVSSEAAGSGRQDDDLQRADLWL